MFKSLLYRLGLSIFPATHFRIQHWRMHRRFGSHVYWARIHEPRTFNEKLLRSKLDEIHKPYSGLVDKAEAKAWVSSRIGKEHIIPTIGVYEDPKDVPIANLPRPCILKPTHASGKVIILNSCNEPSTREILEEMHAWRKMNHYLLSGEPQYRGLQPRIICEPLLGTDCGELLDYKFWCFHGRPCFVQVDFDRHTRHVQRHYDLDWQPQSFSLRYPKPDRDIDRPLGFERMTEVARALAVGFSFVRVDLYAPGGQVYFGEMTFHPGSGNDPFSDYEADLMLGRLLDNSPCDGVAA